MAASVVATVLVAEVADAGRVPRWISVPVTVAAALAVTQWLARGMTSPLREMTSGRATDGRRATTASASRQPRPTRWATLARAFNAMAADLASADTQRRQLVATVSHELRTPLTAQRALLENLVDGVVRPDDDALRGALRQSERLSALVTDLLDLSRIDAGVAPLALTDVRVADLLRDAVAEAGRRRAGPCGCGTRRSPPTSPSQADPARLAQLVANLVDNAVRHSPPQGEVLVVARAMGDAAWCLEVRDEGPGIPADRVERVFDRFGSGDGLRRRHRPGPGHRPLGVRAARRHDHRRADRPGEQRRAPARRAAPAPAHDRPTHLTEERAMTSTPIPAAGQLPAPTASATSTVSAASTARAVTGSAPAAHTPSAPAAAVVATAALAPAPTTQAPAAATVSAGNAPAPGAPAPGAPAEPGAPAVTAASLPPAPVVATSGGDGSLGAIWPERGVPPQPLPVLAALGIGGWAALTWPERNVGLAVALTMLATGLLMWRVARYRRHPWTVLCAVLAALLVTGHHAP